MEWRQRSRESFHITAVSAKENVEVSGAANAAMKYRGPPTDNDKFYFGIDKCLDQSLDIHVRPASGRRRIA
jgi:hypothetical protein